MKRSQMFVTNPAFVDAVADEGDVVEVVTHKSIRGYTLYVHVNSEVVLRIGRVQRLSIPETHIVEGLEV